MNPLLIFKNWFAALDKKNQEILAFMYLSLTPEYDIKGGDYKIMRSPLGEFNKNLDRFTEAVKIGGLCVNIIAQFDLIMRNYDDIDKFTFYQSFLSETLKSFEESQLEIEFLKQIIKKAPENFESNKLLKRTWEEFKDREFNLEVIDKYYRQL